MDKSAGNLPDNRTIPANERVAAAYLQGHVKAARFVEGAARWLTVPVADLLRAPNGQRERQLQMGDVVQLFEVHEGWAFVQSGKDGFVGYLPADVVGESAVPTHWVVAPATHIYPEPDMKSHEVAMIGFGSSVVVIGAAAKFWETPQGYIPKPHLAEVSQRFDDPVTVAALFLGMPYLWGGNSRLGIDCSGLVQAAFHACGLECAGDSDQQEATLGREMAQDEPVARGDLLFWKGHVALVVDENRIIHANAHHMAVVYESLTKAIARIEMQGDGPLTARKRVETKAQF